MYKGKLIKVAFRTKTGGESMWVKPTGQKGGRLTGILKNEPLDPRIGGKKVHYGQEVTFTRGQVLGKLPPLKKKAPVKHVVKRRPAAPRLGGAFITGMGGRRISLI